MNNQWIMYGAERSLFSAKLRPVLRYKQMHWGEHLPDGAAISRHLGVMYVPVLVSPDGRWLQDTTEIIDQLEVEFPEPPLIPGTPLQRTVSRLLELYADEFAIMLAMHTRWTPPESKADMTQYLMGVGGLAEGGAAFAEKMAGALPFLGVSSQTIPALDGHLADVVDCFDTLFSAQPYFLGDRMSLADCSLLGPYYGHVYQDSDSGPKLRAQSLAVLNWIERCNHPNADAMGEWTAGDALTAEARAALGVLGHDAAPVLLAQWQVLQDEDLANRAPGAELTMPTAMYEANLRNTTINAAARPYLAYKMQRFSDTYDGFTDDEQEAVRAGLGGTGWEVLLGLRPAVRVEKRGAHLHRV